MRNHPSTPMALSTTHSHTNTPAHTHAPPPPTHTLTGRKAELNFVRLHVTGRVLDAMRSHTTAGRLAAVLDSVTDVVHLVKRLHQLPDTMGEAGQ